MMMLKLMFVGILGSISIAAQAQDCRLYLGQLFGDVAEEIDEWQRLAQKGDPRAQATVGNEYRRGAASKARTILPKDFEKAFYWFSKSAEQGCEAGEYGLAQLYFNGEGIVDSGDLMARWLKSVFWLEKAAQKGLPAAQYEYAGHLKSGVATKQNIPEAFKWYLAAANQNYNYAQWEVGEMYIEGKGVEKNIVEGYHWLSIAKMPFEEDAKAKRESVRQTMTSSQQQLADKKLQEWKEREDFEWAKGVAEMLGGADAAFRLAWKYYKGVGTPKSYELAFKWFFKAAELGDATSQFNVAFMLHKGQGIQPDLAKAIYWYKLSADQGYASAQSDLGKMYRDGVGVPKDDQTAVMWYLKAANQGDLDAQKNLGYAYGRGIGVPKDSQQAYFWFLLASAQGDDVSIKNRDITEKGLTSSERVNAQAAARDWKAGSASRASSPTDMPAPTNAKPMATGSGFFVARNHIVTNFHVINGCARLAIGGKGVAKVQASDVRNDLALLEVKAGNDSIATLRDGKLRAGEAVTVIGYPLAGLLAQGANVTTGNISALAGPRNDVRLIQFTAPVQSGNSGGPLIDASGNAAGVVASKLDTLKVAKATGEITQNINFAISGTMLQAFLDSAGIHYKTAPLGRKFATADIAERAKLFTALVECY